MSCYSNLIVEGSTMNGLDSTSVLVIVVLNRTVVDSNRYFDNLCGSHL